METYELGLERSFGSFLKSGIHVYKNEGQVYVQNFFKDLTRQGYILGVKGKDTEGFEFVNKFKFNQNLFGFINYSFTDPEDSTAAGMTVDALDVAQNKYHIGLVGRFMDYYGVSLFVRWIDEIESEVTSLSGSGTSIETIDSYTDVSLNFFAQDIDLDSVFMDFIIGVKNLTDDENYLNNPRGTSPSKFQSFGREIFGRFTVKF